MTNKFKVGDIVIVKNNYSHDPLKLFHIIDINNRGILLDTGWYNQDEIKLYSRRIGDKLFKVEELNENGTPIDPEATIHFTVGYKLPKPTSEKFVKYEDRCKSPHTGSSTCYGCDPEFWLDDDPYKKVEVKITHDQLEELNKGGSSISVGYKLPNLINFKSSSFLKEEFKVDKLGWYESKNGEKFKVVHIKNNENRPVITFSENDVCYNFSKEGFFYSRDMSSDCDLVKYLGPELPKEPRKFEFEAEITEDKSDTNFNKFNEPEQDIKLSEDLKNIIEIFNRLDKCDKEYFLVEIDCIHQKCIKNSITYALYGNRYFENERSF